MKKIIIKKNIIIKKKFSDTHKKKKILSKDIIMTNLTKYELKLIAWNRGIKNYQNMSRKKFLRTLNKSDHNFKNISLNALEQIAKMQNLSQNELEQIKRMKNLPQNELEQNAKTRRIKNYKNMSREELLAAFFKIRAKPCRAL